MKKAKKSRKIFSSLKVTKTISMAKTLVHRLAWEANLPVNTVRPSTTVAPLVTIKRLMVWGLLWQINLSTLAKKRWTHNYTVAISTYWVEAISSWKILRKRKARTQWPRISNLKIRQLQAVRCPIKMGSSIAKFHNSKNEVQVAAENVAILKAASTSKKYKNAIQLKRQRKKRHR